MKQVDHPHIVKLKEVYYNNNCVYLIMEYCQGGDLASFLIEKLKRRITYNETIILLRNMIAAVKYLHTEKIIHRKLLRCFIGSL